MPGQAANGVAVVLQTLEETAADVARGASNQDRDHDALYLPDGRITASMT
jgi:hypothetical protein